MTKIDAVIKFNNGEERIVGDIYNITNLFVNINIRARSAFGFHPIVIKRDEIREIRLQIKEKD